MRREPDPAWRVEGGGWVLVPAAEPERRRRGSRSASDAEGFYCGRRFWQSRYHHDKHCRRPWC